MVEVIVVIVRDDDRVQRRQLRERERAAGTSAAGPIQAKRRGALAPDGSVSTRWPSISTSIGEWPSQVTRSPDAGRRREARRDRRATVGSGCSGVAYGTGLEERRSPRPSMSFSSGCGFSKRPSLHCGERSIRARRAASGRRPKEAQPFAKIPAMTMTPSAAAQRASLRSLRLPPAVTASPVAGRRSPGPPPPCPCRTRRGT